MSELEQIQRDIEAAAAQSAARRQWRPAREGEIDIRIAADGSWYHEGRVFQRDALVRLFAGVLYREDDDFFLLTPAEKLHIKVDDAPFVATLVERIVEDGQQAIVFTTNIGERIPLDAAHPLRVDIDPDSREPRPYIHVRDDLDALISRSAFYDLINYAAETERDGERYLSVTSLGETFDIGSIDE